jgi:thioesterase domain-containing protein
MSNANRCRSVADQLAYHGGNALKVMMAGRPDFYAQAVEGLGRNPTDDDFDRMAESLLAALRRGTPDEGKPLLKRMH